MSGMDQEHIQGQLFSTIAGLRGGHALEQMCRILEQLECDRLIASSEQPCEELRSLHSSYYSRLFRRYEHRCTVVDFFTKTQYLGFSKFYPVGAVKIGETALAFPPDDNTRITCWTYFNRLVEGNTESVVAAPFMEQDGHVGRCAQVALWMASRILSRNRSRREVHLPEITQYATAYTPTGPRLPSQGLYWDQMAAAVQNMGYSPLLYHRAPGWFPDGIIYRYVESNIPVVVGLAGGGGEGFGDVAADWGHAVVAVGHRSRRIDLGSIEKGPARYYTPATFVGWYVVNDDQLGPYRLMPTGSNGVTGISIDTETPYDLKDHASFLLALVPEEITLFGEEAEIRALHFAKEQIPEFATDNPQALELRAAVDDGTVVLRTFLVDRRSWLRERTGCCSLLSEAVQAHYRRLELPERFWVVEFSTLSRYNSEVGDEQSTVLAEVVVDPTATVEAPAVLFLNAPGLLISAREARNGNGLYDFARDLDARGIRACVLSQERRRR